MKKLVLFVIVSFFVVAVNAQINVLSNGNVGIKTTSAPEELTVQGQVQINATITPNWGSAIRAYVSNQDACAYHLYNNYYGQDVFWVNGQGKVWCRLGLFYGSDITMKEDVKDITNPIELIKQLHGVKYKYKEPEGKAKNNEERIGLIAQEVEKVIPQAVATMDDGTKAISYNDFIGLLIEAMKEQQAQIESMQQQIDKLTSKDK